MAGRLKDKIALVTGAARGIGLEISRAFLAEGALVWLSDVRAAEGRAAAAALGQGARFVDLDVREEDDWSLAMASLLAAEGRLDILVNNAGVTGLEAGERPQDPENASLEDWRAVHAVNLDGAFLGCKHALFAMRRGGGGAIVNIASRSGQVGVPGAAAYASSKAALRNHTRSVALWCAGQGLKVRCNAIVPAAVLTPMWGPMLGEGPERARRMEAVVADTPLKRFGRPEEVAAAAVFLASEEAGYMTGAEIVLDGGLLAGSVAPPGRPQDASLSP